MSAIDECRRHATTCGALRDVARKVVGTSLAAIALVGAWQFSGWYQAAQEQRAEAEAARDAAELAGRARARLLADAQGVADSATSGAQLLRDLIAVSTSSPDDGIPDTIKDSIETEDWWDPMEAVGSAVVYLGTRQIYLAPDLHTPVAALPELVRRASAEKKAATVTLHEGVPFLVGAARTPVPNRQQAWGVLALLTRITPERLDPLARELGVSVAVLPPRGGLPVLAGAPEPKLDEFLKGPATRASCCARETVAEDITLAVGRAPEAFFAAAQGRAATGRTIAWAVGAALALVLGAFAFWPRSSRDEAHAELLEQTAAQLKQTQEQLQRMSQTFLASSATNPGAGASAATTAPPPEGLDATHVSQAQSRYEIVAPLGEGGMARVAVAQVRGAEGFRRLFVLKRLRPQLAGNQEIVNQFIDEARLGAALVHSNIVPVFDFGRDAEGYFLAQEYILGRDLDALISASVKQRGAGLPPSVVAWVAQEALKALAYSHTKADDTGRPMGLVHRDVSPNNLMVSERGELKLLDFGIVKSDLRLNKTAPGVVKGNIFYMAPEQAQGLTVDPRADLWSLGQVLFTAATGQSLYQGANQFELIMRAAQGVTPADQARIDALPAELLPLLSRLLVNDPAQRFSSADEAARAVPQPVATAAEVQALVQALLGDELRAEQQRLAGKPA